MKLPKWIKEFFNSDDSNKTNDISKTHKPTRRHVKDVKPGEVIIIEWSRIEGGMGKIKCINNDPYTKKILLEVTWSNYKEINKPEKERIIEDYNSYKLKNFHLLNLSLLASDIDSEDDFDIATLQKKMNEALEKEEYEVANELQKKIDNLLKKG